MSGCGLCGCVDCRGECSPSGAENVSYRMAAKIGELEYAISGLENKNAELRLLLDYICWEVNESGMWDMPCNEETIKTAMQDNPQWSCEEGE